MPHGARRADRAGWGLPGVRAARPRRRTHRAADRSRCSCWPGSSSGPHTPGLDAGRRPRTTSSSSPRSAWSSCCSTSGSSSPWTSSTRGGRRLVSAAGVYLVLNVGGGLVLGLALRLGHRRGVGARRASLGISSSAIVTKLLVETRRLGNRETRADPRDHRDRGRLPGVLPRAAAARARRGRRPRRRAGRHRHRVRRSCSRWRGRPLRGDRGRPSWSTPTTRRSSSSCFVGLGDHHRRRGRGAGRLRRDRRVHGRPHPRRHGERRPGCARSPTRSATRSARSSSSPSG